MPTLPAEGAAAPAPPPVAPLAAELAAHAADTDLLYVAGDEQRAAALAAILAAFLPDAVVAHLPSSDALPGDAAPPSPGNVGRRLTALRRLRHATGRVVVVTAAEATAVRYPAPDAFDDALLRFATGEAIDLDRLDEVAAELGYVADERVDEPGEFAVRGAVADLFPVDADAPVRIAVADGRVEAIHAFDPATQLTTITLSAIEIGRATEPPLDSGVDLLAHLPAGVAVASDPDAPRRRAQFLSIATDGARRRRQAAELVDEAAWTAALKGHERLAMDVSDDAPPRFVEDRDPARAFTRFARATLAGGKLLLVGSARDLRYLSARLARARLNPQPVDGWAAAVAAAPGALMTLVAPVDRGFVADELTVVAGGDLLGGRARGDELSVETVDAFAGAGELRLGDVVVHEQFGLGRVLGLEALPDDAGGGDAITLEYAKGAHRLVPVAEAGQLWRYGADADAVTLDALDGHTWLKRRGDIDAAIAESARGLTALAAERAAKTTEPIAPDPAAYERFSAGFPFTETADQARAIAAVRADLSSGKPMDRLVVGDVGYGKTEVALRAAALAALAGRQVAVAAPTTVLVRQHLETFRRRFEGTGVEVAGLSRLSSAAERKRVHAGLADGSIAVVVGTGAVAGKGVAYKDLALVVIDEEQRFGAADKTRLRELGAGHVLTLTATPIPRTLQTALVGLQDLSVIATPPARRQPIRTAVERWDDALVRTALLRERGRGGQSFVVVPRVEDMGPLAERLVKLVPELSVVQAHGKMPADAIDAAMVGFADGEGDVLLATNIIEAGLDVPRANTMIVHHADRFGLSQLHQLRGRVGRGGRRGQVLLLTDEGQEIAPATLKRLRTLQAFDRLGAGFQISARDLDLRGAGDLLGEEQAGHSKLIGVDLYQHLLGQALRAARGEAVDEWTPELHLGAAGRFPAEWVPDVEARLGLYVRFARLESLAELDAFADELEDRFGALPDEATALLGAARIRLLARAAGVARIDAGPAAIALTPRDRGDPPAGHDLLAKGERWLLKEAIDDPAARVERVETLLAELAER